MGVVVVLVVMRAASVVVVVAVCLVPAKRHGQLYKLRWPQLHQCVCQCVCVRAAACLCACDCANVSPIGSLLYTFNFGFLRYPKMFKVT